MMIGKLRGLVLKVDKMGERTVDSDGKKWEKCVFTVKIEGYSKRTPNKNIPQNIIGKEVKLVRWCCFDWHYKIGIKKTLEPDETEAVLKGEPTDTVYW